jgi:hypothetical protein
MVPEPEKGLMHIDDSAILSVDVNLPVDASLLTKKYNYKSVFIV